MQNIEGWFKNLIRDNGYGAIVGITILVIFLLIVLRQLFVRHDDIR